MGTRTDGSPEGVTAGRTAITCVVSRHLLVAQAVSAALTSVGVHIPAIPWEAVAKDLDIPDRTPGSGTHQIVVLDDVDDPMPIADISALVGRAEGRVLVATSHPPDLYWGGLFVGARVTDVGLATSVRELADLIEQFEAGETSLDPTLRSVLADEWVEDLKRQRELAALIATLSPQERRVLEMLADGNRVPDIGKQLGVSESTVRTHVKALRRKLSVDSQLAAVALFIQFKDAGLPSRLVPRPRVG